VLLLLALTCISTAFVTLHRAEPDVRIPDKYIMVFSPKATTKSLYNYMSKVLSQNISYFDTFQIGDMRGAFAQLTPSELEEHLRYDDIIDYIEEDQIVTIAQQCTSQNNPIWNLRRCSERAIDLSDPTFYHHVNQGNGVDVYVIDTGVRPTHNEFSGGRATQAVNYAGDGQNTDCNGHGTHVAGTAAGSTYGLAKRATIIGVKVLTCAGSGSNAGVIQGIQYVASRGGSGTRPCVANMSLGGGYSAAVNNAVTQGISAGCVFVLAAGNSNADACNSSPASTPTAITVGSTMITNSGGQQWDYRSTFSNWGTCVHIFAPGSTITSAWHTSNTATNTISGTSMASPHVAGGAALLLGKSPNLTPAQVKTQLKAAATQNMIEMSCTGACGNTVNQLLYVGDC